jgi:hypothetical protein
MRLRLLLFPLAASCSLSAAACARADRFPLALALHAAGSAATALALHFRLPERMREPRPPLLGLFFCLAFLLPGIGALGLFVALEAGLAPARRAEAPAAPRMVDVPALPARAPGTRAPGAVDLTAPSAVLAHASDPARRLRVVLGARRLRGGPVAALLAAALRDPLDDVRLLSHALIARREQEVFGRIESRLRLLETAPAADRLGLHRLLSLDHWQLAHDGLVQGDLLTHALEQARAHAEQAIAIAHGDGTLHVLSGRILLRLSRPAEARAALERGLALGASRLSVLPWLAEAAFRERRFADLRAALSALDLRFLGSSPLLRARSFWR